MRKKLILGTIICCLCFLSGYAKGGGKSGKCTGGGSKIGKGKDRPAGWDKGEKKGWCGEKVPPGQEKKKLKEVHKKGKSAEKTLTKKEQKRLKKAEKKRKKEQKRLEKKKRKEDKIRKKNLEKQRKNKNKKL